MRKLMRFFLKLLTLSQNKIKLKFYCLIYPGLTIKGKTFLDWKSSLSVEDGSSIYLEDTYICKGARILSKKNGKISIKKSYIGENCHIECIREIKIEENCLLSPLVYIFDFNHKFGDKKLPIKSQGFEARPVKIRQNVWIGAKASILAGVTIEENTVIGANSLVTRDIPPNVVAAGSPAKIIKNIS